ncbi:hypothetical protein PICMEDRAFT_89515 [Pichia membranifaciens NRRL Y-2026]|uniref:CRIB domain-containing protein n=1 Tax=Pichia membranifaciens NRRL Y-2026 TaxID=763406 RepID=A0A1E3NTG7_9ASCO|nr:hypothetical protein PICMEDRAFT_89515 [Pichia membranifaciens NRRL Y-2026]ODQ48958.1 hypothetical protein PICMEDRAFT_89515 [Pichia membranifaciens NRRL Y-2026]
MVGTEPNGNYESLWLDSKNHSQQAKNVALKLMQSEKFQTKLMKLIQHFDSSTPKDTHNHPSTASSSPLRPGHAKRSISGSSISNPISFSHVSHVDAHSNFGLADSFNPLNLNQIDRCLPAHSLHRSSIACSNNDTSYTTEDSDADPFESTLDPATSGIKAFSTYRTSPTYTTHSIIPSHSGYSLSNRLHRRTSSASTNFNVTSSQFSTNSIFTSNNAGVCSSDTSRGSSPRNSLKVKVLPCIPQEDLTDRGVGHERESEYSEPLMEQEEDEENPFLEKFVSIPSAPPPPKSVEAPEDRLKSFLQREEIEIASDSEDDDICFEKFRLSSNIESITSELQAQLQKRLNSENKIMNKEYRKSIMILLQKEVQEQSLLEDLEEEEDLEKSFFEGSPSPKHNARRNPSTLLSRMEHIEEELEADDEGEDDDTEGTSANDNCSIMKSLALADSTSLIDTAFELDAETEEENDHRVSAAAKRLSVLSDFFADLQLNETTLLDSDDRALLGL